MVLATITLHPCLHCSSLRHEKVGRVECVLDLRPPAAVVAGVVALLLRHRTRALRRPGLFHKPDRDRLLLLLEKRLAQQPRQRRQHTLVGQEEIVRLGELAALLEDAILFAELGDADHLKTTMRKRGPGVGSIIIQFQASLVLFSFVTHTPSPSLPFLPHTLLIPQSGSTSLIFFLASL